MNFFTILFIFCNWELGCNHYPPNLYHNNYTVPSILFNTCHPFYPVYILYINFVEYHFQFSFHLHNFKKIFQTLMTYMLSNVKISNMSIKAGGCSFWVFHCHLLLKLFFNNSLIFGWFFFSSSFRALTLVGIFHNLLLTASFQCTFSFLLYGIIFNNNGKKLSS